jgi:hypothetical protein
MLPLPKGGYHSVMRYILRMALLLQFFVNPEVQQSTNIREGRFQATIVVVVSISGKKTETIQEVMALLLAPRNLSP